MKSVKDAKGLWRPSTTKTVNKHFCTDVLQCPREAMSQQQPEKWHNGKWADHHNKPTSHSTLSVQQFLANTGMTDGLTHLYSPEPSIMWLYSFPDTHAGNAENKTSWHQYGWRIITCYTCRILNSRSEAVHPYLWKPSKHAQKQLHL